MAINSNIHVSYIDPQPRVSHTLVERLRISPATRPVWCPSEQRHLRLGSGGEGLRGKEMITTLQPIV